MDKRSFLKQLTLLGLSASPSIHAMDNLLRSVEHLPSSTVAKDEDFWAKIRGGYKLKPDYINLENGYYCFLPQETLENYINHVREVNYQGSYYMRTVQWQNKQAMAAKLADLAGCDKEEMIITRNTTESLDIVVSGMHWKEGDEAVMAEQDYFSMRLQFKLAAKRYGIVNKTVSVPVHPKSDQEIVDLYASAITDKTKLLMVCHMVNITGHILPIRKICDMAHKRGVLVMVDGAHAFAHINFSMKDLDCDYYGTSLHKWLSVPLGAGFLYVKKGKVDQVWPLLAGSDKEPNDIASLNHIGTHPAHTDLAIGNAIDYYLKIGRDRKEERLRYLQRYWSDQVRGQGNIIINTPEDPKLSCGIANVGINGMKPKDLADTLMKKYKIFTVAIDESNVHGCRISPNVYTTTKELDVFVKALKEMGNA
ncbi:MAG: aminotransferase class V-fold PLP-dependent enzyme [Cyclobacteriaceae bacterium]|nr:aminotransferase class V-fold PLP-dependent enzyme [Cyclobacteriaceae bacterium]